MPDLEALLQAARKYRALNPMTEEERSAQVRSFAYGNVAMHNAAVTREMVDEEADKLIAKRTTLAPPLPLGTEVGPWGKISAVRFIGERYYWLIDAKGTVSMMPADVVEPKGPPK